MNQHQGHRSKKKAAYYDRQFTITRANKKRRADRREHRRVLTLRRNMLARIPSRHESQAAAANSNR